MEAAVKRVARALGRARRVLVITGAGLSVDSGLPTYRGLGGLYDTADTEDGVPIEVALSGRMMRENPTLCWRYITQIEAACAGAEPNRGHAAIAALEADDRDVWVLTQNVDGFHRAAGSTAVIDIHGDLHWRRCTQCAYRHERNPTETTDEPPACPRCRAPLRPDVVLFDEMLPVEKVHNLRRQLLIGFDVTLSVGTSSLFPYIAQPVELAHQRGSLAVEINPQPTPVSSHCDVVLRMGATEAFEALLTQIG